MSLNQFISEVKTGLSLNNHYQVFITRPDGMIFQNLFTTSNPIYNKLALLCEQATLPGINIATTPTRTFGESIETPYDKIYHPVNLSFYVDSKYQVKYFFDSWMNVIQSNTTRIHNYPNSYKTNIDIVTYDKQDTKTYMTRLYDAYPKTIGDIQLSYNNVDIIKLPVELTYRYYKTETLSSGSYSFDSNLSFYLSNFVSFQSIANNALSGLTDSIIRDVLM